MEKSGQKIATRPLNYSLEVFSEFIQQLNIFRRHQLTYPENHPVLNFSIEKTLALLPQLFNETETLQCAVTKQGLFLEEIQLDPKNKTFQDFASALSSKGIVLLSFKKGLTSRELCSFCELLNRSIEDIMAQGGIQHTLDQYKFKYIHALKMNYNVFQVVEGANPSKDQEQTHEPETLWERFARTLVEDSTGLTGDSSHGPIFDPAQLAEFLNQKNTDIDSGTTKSRQKNLDFLLERFEREGVDGYFYYVQALENFTKFIENLSPELRSQFMKGVFKNYDQRSQSVENVLNRFSSKTILKILNDINSENMAVSQTVFSLLGNLSEKSSQDRHDTKRTFNPQIENKLKSLFKEDINEQFINEDYQKTLDSLVNHKTRASDEILNEIPSPQEEFSPHTLELQQGRIVLELLRSATDREAQQEIKNNIFQTLNYFLETSDFMAIQKVYTRLSTEETTAKGEQADFFQELLGFFEKPEFTGEVLGGLNTWGKDKLEEIRMLIESIGYPFVPALLNQLAEEPKRTTRRFILEQLYKIAPQGPADPILEMLEDSRWYVVRNMILLLRTLGDSSVVEFLEKQVAFPHPKVRFEIIKTFLHFQHPLGTRYLLEDLSGTDEEKRTSAILLAELSQSPGVREKLLELLNKRGFSKVNLETKKQIVKTLAAIKDPVVLPALKRILNSVSFLNPVQLKELKMEIRRSLSSYPDHNDGSNKRRNNALETKNSVRETRGPENQF